MIPQLFIAWLTGLLVALVPALPSQAGDAMLRSEDRGPLGPRLLTIQPEELPADAAPRTEELLCYHTGDVYYIRSPHSIWGDIGPLYQRITPGAGGTLTGCRLRLLNDYGSNEHHHGQLQFGVHRREGSRPGDAVETLSVDAGDYGNGIFDWPLSGDFEFEPGEDFFLSLRFLPSTPLDTIAYVTAGLGEWTGHSFFYLDGETAWWGDPEGAAFGDMHFCAEVTLIDRQPFLLFPWSQLDLGRCRAGEPWEIRLPILNQGTAPLAIHEASLSAPDWTLQLLGPDSLDAPDTLLLVLQWPDPPPDTEVEALLTLRSNAVDSLRLVPLRATTSSADLLLADWSEWPVEVVQLADSGAATGCWQPYFGLHRPQPFYGHDSPEAGVHAMDLLVLSGLPVEQGAMVEFRWSQHFRHLELLEEHAFAWRDPVGGQWQVLDDPDLTGPLWTGPAGTWLSTPWLSWGPAPTGGLHDFGLLYEGQGSGDMWFIDDLEVRVRPPLAAPQLSIRRHGCGVHLSWPPVEHAARYRIERRDATGSRMLALTDACSWIDRCALQGRLLATYRVIAEDAVGPGPALVIDPARMRPLRHAHRGPEAAPPRGRP
jgi:hypothetical protein